ncbi:MAG: response regulator [Nitrospirota bacterium]|nr:response regulator [Nitrospirota bacterium]
MRKPRVMIYEDDIVTLNMLKRFFARRGYEVYSSSEPVVCPLYEIPSDSDKCEQKNQCADVVISEFKMPKTTGIELFRRQLERGCNVDIKMKAITSVYSDEELLKMCRDLGCRFFEKPVELSDLSGWLTECEKHYDLSQPLNDKRAGTRHVFNQVIEYFVNPEASHEKFIGITLDKSFDGLGLRIFNPLRTGEEITIYNRFEKTKKPGVVLWCRRQGKTIYRAGLRLLDK